MTPLGKLQAQLTDIAAGLNEGHARWPVPELNEVIAALAEYDSADVLDGPTSDPKAALLELRGIHGRHHDLEWEECEVCGIIRDAFGGGATEPPDQFEPNPEAVARISRHLLGEDMRNVRAAINAFPNGYTVTGPEAAATPQVQADPPDWCGLIGTFMGQPQYCGEPKASRWHQQGDDFYKHDFVPLTLTPLVQADPPAEGLQHWAEEARRFLASDFSDHPDFEKRERAKIVKRLGQALDATPAAKP